MANGLVLLDVEQEIVRTEQTIEELLQRSRDDLSTQEAAEILGYTRNSVREREKEIAKLQKTRKHLAQLSEMYVTPYDEKSVDAYTEKNLNWTWWTKCFTRNASRIALWLMPLVAMGVCIWWSAVSDAHWFPIVASILLGIGQAVVWGMQWEGAIDMGMWKCKWVDSSISMYAAKPEVPDEALVMGAKLVSKLGGSVYVRSLVLEKEKAPRRTLDPFLIWEPLKYGPSYVIAYWDEPKYQPKKVAQPL